MILPGKTRCTKINCTGATPGTSYESHGLGYNML